MADNIFTPSICKGEGAKYKGTVTIRPMSYDERLDIYELIGFDQEGDKALQNKFYLKVLREIGKRSHSFVKCCDLERLSDGYKFADWNEVYHDSDLTSLVTEVCSSILGKITAGM